MGKYEKKNHTSGGRYQRRREKKKSGRVLPALLAVAVLLAVVILLFDDRETPVSQTEPAQIERSETVPVQPSEQSAESTEAAPTQALQQPQETRQTQENGETQQTQAAWFDYLFDRIEGKEEASAPTEEQASQTTEPTQPAPMGTKFQRMTYMEMASGDLVLVNGEYGFPSSMVSVTTLHDKAVAGYHVEDVTLSVQSHVVEPLNAWLGAFCAETGNREVLVASGYRTEDPQMPEFHTGLAVELDTFHIATTMDGDEVYEKLIESAWEYGFVQRWPEEKAELTGISGPKWHFRYVGIPHSVVMEEEDLCLEEYLEYIRAYTFEEGPLEVVYQDREYEIYYCEGLEITVPVNRKYTISGNNVDGFILTVEVDS